MENTLVKDIDFDYENCITIKIDLKEMAKLGCLEDYIKLRGQSFEGEEYDYVYLGQARMLGLIKS